MFTNSIKRFVNVFDQGGPASKCCHCGAIIFNMQQMMDHECPKEKKMDDKPLSEMDPCEIQALLCELEVKRCKIAYDMAGIDQEIAEAELALFKKERELEGG